jgi:hypothetical protein
MGVFDVNLCFERALRQRFEAGGVPAEARATERRAGIQGPATSFLRLRFAILVLVPGLLPLAQARSLRSSETKPDHSAAGCLPA